MKTTPPLLCVVALLGFAGSLKGAVIYTLPPVPLNITGISSLDPVFFDIDANGDAEFSFYVGSALSMTPYDGSRSADVFGSVRSFEEGELVGLGVDWDAGEQALYACANFDGLGLACSGAFRLGMGILGLEFQIDGAPHYGWARVQTFPPFIGGRILDWAYESEPNTAIVAGAIPEPEAGLLLLLGFGALLRRRRRQITP